MERRVIENIEVAAPDPSLHQPPSPEEIARRREVFQQMMEDRKNAPCLKTPIVEMVRQLREESER